MDGVKYYANEPTLLGKAFLRLERDFDNHVNYCKDEHLAQEFLDTSDAAFDYFAVSWLWHFNQINVVRAKCVPSL